ncbi:cysteine-rich receptor-like protein kinase, partial [Trifolium pratense]
MQAHGVRSGEFYQRQYGEKQAEHYNMNFVEKQEALGRNSGRENYGRGARVASFDRNDVTEGQRRDTRGLELTKSNNEPVTKEGNSIDPQKVIINGNDVRVAPLGPQVKKGVVRDADTDTKDSGAVRVGEVVVSLGERKEKAMCHKDQVQEGGLTHSTTAPPKGTLKGKDRQGFMRSFRTEADDVTWAQNGLVATIVNGEAVSVVQSRILDAGFSDVILIPMGADRVFVRSSTSDDVLAVFKSAKEFFQLIFSSWTRWDNIVQPYKRGAWVRLYGIPLQAWNVNFFKLCVFECGSFLRADICSVEKDRLDFARILIATPDLEIVNRVVSVLVDGIQVEVNIVEEWGCNLGEDICLFEDDGDSEVNQSDHEEGQGDPEVQCHIDTMVENFVKGMEEEDDIGSQENFQLSNTRGGVEGGSEDVGEAGAHPFVPRVEHFVRSNSRASETRDSPLSTGGQGSVSICSPTNERGRYTGDGGCVGSVTTLKRGDRAKSCPPGANRSMLSGPWSLEWLHDLNQGDAGVIFSARKRSCKGDRNGGGIKKSVQEDPKRRKGGGVFRHTISSVKKIARMPSEDRAKVLKVLKKNERSCRTGVVAPRVSGVSRQVSSTVSSSTTSGTNDWQHWVVMRGSEQVAADDVRVVGEAIGLGGLAKRQEVHKMVGHQIPLLLCLQETKMQSCDDFICSTLWGNSPHAFSYRPSVGALGGLLTLWDSAEVEVWSSESSEYVLWCHGRFVRSGEEFYLANVYAPCDAVAKQVLWDSLSIKIQALGRSRVCVCGDFNAVRSVDERLSVRDGYRSSDHFSFNRFINDNTLIDLPLCGRKYTWFKGDGRSMSRLDRFLLSGEWCLTWPNCTRVSRMRGLSDHCPLVLATDEEDWGP